MNALLSVPVDELLSLWTELEEARHGTNGFGGNTAEIYRFRLQRRSPAREDAARNGPRNWTNSEIAADDAAAARAFHDLIALFVSRHKVEVDVDGRPFDRWIVDDDVGGHRWHVRIR